VESTGMNNRKSDGIDNVNMEWLKYGITELEKEITVIVK